MRILIKEILKEIKNHKHVEMKYEYFPKDEPFRGN